MKIVRMGECNSCGDCCRPETLKARIEAYRKAGITYDLVNKNCSKFDSEAGLRFAGFSPYTRLT